MSLARSDQLVVLPNTDLIVLSEHVDYSDSLGSKDRFSLPDFTQRQKDYQTFFQLSRINTPQTIVNGSVQFNGTDSVGIQQASNKPPRPNFENSSQRMP